MKSISTLILLLFSLLTLSCTKDSTTQEMDAEITNSKIAEIFVMPEVEQRIAFNMLNGIEKQTLWHTRWNKMVEDNRYTSQQLALIKELKNKATKEIYSDQGKLDKFAQDWLTRAAKNFTPDQIINLAFKVSNPLTDVTLKSLRVAASTATSEATKSCDCNHGSLYSCNTGVTDCKTSADNCSKSTAGCGFLFSYQCNGLCKPY